MIKIHLYSFYDNSFDNQGYATITSPGNDPFVITVGAMKTLSTTSRADDEIASYSSKGPTLIDHVVKPDLVAPGNLIVSLRANGSAYLVKNYGENKVGQRYFKLSGTSMATPMVSGEWSGSPAAAARSNFNPGPGEGKVDEDRFQDLPLDEHGYGSGDGRNLHQPVRHFHHRCRLPGRFRRAVEY